MKLAVLGYGYLGKWHAEKAHTLLGEDFCALIDPSEEAQAKAKELYPHLQCFSNLDEAIDSFDAAVVVSPTSLHFGQVKTLIANNKHVFCEKPLTPSFEEAKEIKSLLEGKKLSLQVGHIERFNPVWDKLGELKPYLESFKSLEMYRCAPHKGRALDVDVVQDLMIHDIELMLWMVGEEPERVEAIGCKNISDYWDYVKATFYFKGGREATLISTRNHVQEERRSVITSSKGLAHVDFYQRKVSIADSSNNGKVDIQEYELEGRDLLLEEQKEFYQTIQNNESPKVGINEAMKAIYWMDEVRLCLKQMQ